MLDSDRNRIFNEWLASHKGSCSKWSSRTRSSTQTARIALIDPYVINLWRRELAEKRSSPVFLLSLVLMFAMGFMSARVNGQNPYDKALVSAVWVIFIGLFGGWVAGVFLRRWNRRIGAPRKRRLEALLKEFDG